MTISRRLSRNEQTRVDKWRKAGFKAPPAENVRRPIRNLKR